MRVGRAPGHSQGARLGVEGQRPRLFNGYHVADFAYGQAELSPELIKAVDGLAGTGGTLWLGLNKVQFPMGVPLPPDYGDTIVVPQLRQLLAYAKPRG